MPRVEIEQRPWAPLGGLHGEAAVTVAVTAVIG
jgi:hypothetical protein